MGGQHLNVLAYVDSWEQDEALYIQIELREFGNFALFLGDFSFQCLRLDEARVWKIFVDLSNVSTILHQ
jgi:mitosis inhibitor protein kinase SWE1